MFFSVVGPFTAPGPMCFTEGMVDSGRYENAINTTHGVKSDICTLDWATDLQAISRSVFGARNSFELYSVARSAADLTVSVNGMALGTGWRYDAAINAVVFTTAPAPGAVIGVSYRTACF